MGYDDDGRPDDLDEVFRAAGLIREDGGVPPGTLPVLSPTAASARPADGRVVKTVDHGTPGLVGTVNRWWFEFAERYGLFDHKGEFLVACWRGATDEPSFWSRVRLAPVWDLAGAGAGTGFFGSASGLPEFIALALDSSVEVQITVCETCVGVLALPEPGSRGVLRDHLVRSATEPVLVYTDMEHRGQAREWLRHRAPELLPEDC